MSRQGTADPGVGQMLRPAAIEFGGLLGSELQLRISVSIYQTFPEGDGKLGNVRQPAVSAIGQDPSVT